MELALPMTHPHALQFNTLSPCILGNTGRAWYCQKWVYIKTSNQLIKSLLKFLQLNKLSHCPCANFDHQSQQVSLIAIVDPCWWWPLLIAVPALLPSSRHHRPCVVAISAAPFHTNSLAVLAPSSIAIINSRPCDIAVLVLALLPSLSQCHPCCHPHAVAIAPLSIAIVNSCHQLPSLIAVAVVYSRCRCW